MPKKEDVVDQLTEGPYLIKIVKKGKRFRKWVCSNQEWTTVLVQGHIFKIYLNDQMVLESETPTDNVGALRRWARNECKKLQGLPSDQGVRHSKLAKIRKELKLQNKHVAEVTQKVYSELKAKYPDLDICEDNAIRSLILKGAYAK